MKTKQIPAIVMLTAGFVMCIVSFLNGYGISFLLHTLAWVLPVFFILGFVIKIVLDRNVEKLDEDDVTAEDLGFTDGEILEDLDDTQEGR